MRIGHAVARLEARLFVAIATCVLVARPAVASAERRIDVWAAYRDTQPSFDSPHLFMGDQVNGWSAGLDVPLAGPVGVAASVDGAYGITFREGVVVRPGNQQQTSAFGFMLGPRVGWSFGRIDVFADAQVGSTRVTARSMGVDFLSAVSDRAVSEGVGGGVNLLITRHVGLRAFEFGFRHAYLFDQSYRETHISVGVLLRIP